MSVSQIEPGLAEREAFAQQGYAVLPALLEPALAGFFWSYVHTKLGSQQISLEETQGLNTPSVYGDPTFEGLLEYLRPRIERNTGRRLYPTYSYCRFYKHGDVLKRHRDRPACEISISLNIGQVPSDPWPLCIEGKVGTFAASLSPGDGLLYRGIEYFHWRERFEGNRLVQVFLHYVDADGPYSDQKFDKRKMLMT